MNETKSYTYWKMDYLLMSKKPRDIQMAKIITKIHTDERYIKNIAFCYKIHKTQTLIIIIRDTRIITEMTHFYV